MGAGFVALDPGTARSARVATKLTDVGARDAVAFESLRTTARESSGFVGALSTNRAGRIGAFIDVGAAVEAVAFEPLCAIAGESWLSGIQVGAGRVVSTGVGFALVDVDAGPVFADREFAAIDRFVDATFLLALANGCNDHARVTLIAKNVAHIIAFAYRWGGCRF